MKVWLHTYGHYDDFMVGEVYATLEALQAAVHLAPKPLWWDDPTNYTDRAFKEREPWEWHPGKEYDRKLGEYVDDLTRWSAGIDIFAQEMEVRGL